MERITEYYPSQLNYPDLPQDELERWRELIEERSGIYFTDSRAKYLKNCLLDRMRELGLGNCSQYLKFIVSNPYGEREWEELLEKLVNSETSFFRYLPSFNALRDKIIPELLQRKSETGDKDIAIWSVGCSLGHEAYSLAMVISDEIDLESYGVRILGSDISKKNLSFAKNGVYPQKEIRDLTYDSRVKYLKRTNKLINDSFSFKSSIKTLMEFKFINLKDIEKYKLPKIDVIFCQNVFIYFAAELKQKIFDNLCLALMPGGYLFLTPAEEVGLKLENVEKLQIGEALAFRKTKEGGL